MTTPAPKANYGTFRIETPDGDGPIVTQLQEHAAVNRDKPGQSWSRIVAVGRGDRGEKIQGIRMWHLDTNRGLLVVTESWNGVETARLARVMPQA